MSKIENLVHRAYRMSELFLQFFDRLIGFCHLKLQRFEAQVHVLLLNEGHKHTHTHNQFLKCEDLLFKEAI